MNTYHISTNLKCIVYKTDWLYLEYVYELYQYTSPKPNLVTHTNPKIHTSTKTTKLGKGLSDLQGLGGQGDVRGCLVVAVVHHGCGCGWRVELVEEGRFTVYDHCFSAELQVECQVERGGRLILERRRARSPVPLTSLPPPPLDFDPWAHGGFLIFKPPSALPVLPLFRFSSPLA